MVYEINPKNGRVDAYDVQLKVIFDLAKCHQEQVRHPQNHRLLYLIISLVL
jgi:uncharacterized Rmd1/YagE family protein